MDAVHHVINGVCLTGQHVEIDLAARSMWLGVSALVDYIYIHCYPRHLCAGESKPTCISAHLIYYALSI